MRTPNASFRQAQNRCIEEPNAKKRGVGEGENPVRDGATSLRLEMCKSSKAADSVDVDV